MQLSNLTDTVVQKRINSQLKHDAGADETYDDSDWYMQVDKKYIDGELLSVLSSGTSYSHGAVGAENLIVSSNFSLKTGGKIYFKDLFEAGYIEKMNSISKKILHDKGYGEYFSGLKDDQCYYFNGQYLSLCFNEGDVAANAEGAVTIDIPLKEIKDLISVNGPLSYAL